LISVATKKGNLNSFAAVLGNNVAIRAYREGKLPFPDGAIIAACTTVMSRRRKTTKSLADPSLSSPAPHDIQFMIKDSTKYATTGGWGSLTSKTANPATKRS